MTSQSDRPFQVTVLGAGFAALSSVRELRRRDLRAQITLIAPQAELHYLPGIILLVHGEHDRTVPLTDALRLRAALKQGELLVVDGDHDLRPTLAPQAERLVQFFATHLDAIPR